MQNRHRCINTGNQSLGSCFFISAASIKLSAAEQTADIFELQGRIELLRINAVVLDSISISYNFTMLQTGNGAVHS